MGWCRCYRRTRSGLHGIALLLNGGLRLLGKLLCTNSTTSVVSYVMHAKLGPVLANVCVAAAMGPWFARRLPFRGYSSLHKSPVISPLKTLSGNIWAQAEEMIRVQQSWYAMFTANAMLVTMSPYVGLPLIARMRSDDVSHTSLLKMRSEFTKTKKHSSGLPSKLRKRV